MNTDILKHIESISRYLGGPCQYLWHGEVYYGTFLSLSLTKNGKVFYRIRTNGDKPKLISKKNIVLFGEIKNKCLH